MDRETAYARVTSEAVPSGDCLLDTVGYNMRGYHGVWIDGVGNTLVHRLVAEERLGRPLLPGRAETVDHTCHNADAECNDGESCQHRRCVNFDHFDLVDQTENWRRGRLGVQAKRLAKTHCPQNHPYEEGNLVGGNGSARQCRACHRARHAGRDPSLEPTYL